MKMRRLISILLVIAALLMLLPSCGKLVKRPEADRMAGKIPEVRDASFETYYAAGNGCDEIIYGKATAKKFAAYVEELKAAGYKAYAENEIAGNPFATLYNDEYIINAGFYKNEKKMRIVVGPYDEKQLVFAENENDYEVVTTSKITMPGLCYTNAEGKKVNNGACFIIRLADGRFIIVDGGHNHEMFMEQIIALLKEQSADYVEKTGGIKIAAWIITHPHGDHWSALRYYYDQLVESKITVEKLMYNFFSEEELARYNEEREASLNFNAMPKAAKALGADVVNPHVGQVYYVADVKLDVLYTIESYAPNVINDYNGMSIVFKFTFTDPATSEETTFMMLGDATGYAMRCMAGTFGNYLKSDISQVTHHGAQTWGDDEGAIMGYKLIKPATLLWAAADSVYGAYSGNAYNAVLFDLKSNPEYKECYMASTARTVTQLDIPYKVGTADVRYRPDIIKHD